MKKNLPALLLCMVLAIYGNSPLQAQTTITEGFESYGLTGVTSFTNSGQQINLIGGSFAVNQYQTGNGNNGSNKYIDNAGNTNTLSNGTGTNKTYSMKTNNGLFFSVKQLYLFVSTNSGGTPGGGTGTVTINLKRAGSTAATISLPNSFFLTNFNAPNMGFTLINFATAGAADYSTVPMDELEINYGTGYNYFAIDDFTYSLVSNWTGGTGAWGTGSNWDRTTVPTASIETYIASGSPSVSGTINCSSLTVSGTGSLTIPNGATLQVGNAITANGSINATAGTIVLNGTTAQKIPASTFSTNTIANLTINNTAGATLGGTLNITGILTPTAGTFTTGGFLTLKSSSISSTAMIGVTGGSISGNVTVERFIPARRGFRLLAPGVTTSTSIRANWQEGQNNTTTGSNSNTNAGYGTHITGSTNGSNGFDATSSGNASLFTFSNSAANTWTQAANTNSATLNASVAYRLMVRGSRSISLSTNTPTPDNTILRATGTVNEAATVVFNAATSPTALNSSSTTNQNFSMVPNPYWCAINWNTFNRINVGGSYYIWDPTQGTRGAYTSWNGTVSSGGGTISRYIQPGQAFFVTSTSATPSLSIQQSDKAPAQANLTTTFRTQEDFAKMRIALSYTDANGDLISADGATAIFGNYHAAIDNNEEAFKMTNLDEMLSINRNGTLLSIEARPLPTDNDTLPLELGQFTQTAYQLNIANSNFNGAVTTGYVVDRYLHVNYPLDMDGATNVPVVLTNDAASKAADRFMVVLGKTALANMGSTVTVALSPNPASNMVKVGFSNAAAAPTTVSIIGMDGKLLQTVQAGHVQSGSVSMSVRGLAKGSYLVSVYNGTTATTEKLMIQ